MLYTFILQSIIINRAYLASSLHICVHARCVRYIFTVETCLGYCVVNWIIYTWCTWYFAQILMAFVFVFFSVTAGITVVLLPLCEDKK